MKHFYQIAQSVITPVLLSGFYMSAYAQIPQTSDFCRAGTLSRQMQDVLGTREAYLARHGENLEAVHAGLADQRAVKVLPTVVHVIYDGPSENVPDARINDFIAAINRSFNGQNNQTGVRAQFQSVIGNPQVQFCLATTDPNGQPTTGIVRKSTTKSVFPIDDIQNMDAPIKESPDGSPTWDPRKYVNIWVVDLGWLTLGGGVAGFAYQPNSFSLSGPVGYMDGLVVDVNATFTQSAQGDYSIGIHELGHYLGLDHTFSNSCSTDGDGFTDTPISDSPTFDQANCDATVNKCGNTVQTENFMDYTTNCHKMFTLQQSAYINVVLNSTNGFRKQLLWNGCASGLDIDEADFAAGLNLYPNPSTGLTTLSIDNASNYTDLRVTLYNSVGVRLYQTSGNVPSELNLDLATYGAGIYFVEVRSNEGLATKRLVLNK